MTHPSPTPETVPRPSIDAKQVADLTAASVASGLDAAKRLRTLGLTVIDMAHDFNAACEREAAAIESATEGYAERATQFANTVFVQGTQVAAIQEAVEDIVPRPRIVPAIVKTEREPRHAYPILPS